MVFIDVMGIGLVLPMMSTIILDAGTPFLPAATSTANREIYFGILTGAFFLAWFAGATLVAKVSDYIGRKRGVLICLFGALAGYALTIVSLYVASFWLLVAARMVTGFTAANQPIAQAALVDISRDEQEKTKNLGNIVAASALGLLLGPLMAGVLSDTKLLGDAASIKLPFYGALVLVVANTLLVLFFYREQEFERRRIDFGLSEVFFALAEIRHHPTILRLVTVYIPMILAPNAFFIFMNTYLFKEFKFGTLANSAANIVFGLSMACASSYLVPLLATRFKRLHIIAGTMLLIALGNVLFVLNPSWLAAYVLILPISIGLGVAYPTVLALFSGAAKPGEIGWVMGLTISVYALGTGTLSLLGGPMMTFNIGMPMLLASMLALIALILIATLGRGNRLRRLDPAP